MRRGIGTRHPWEDLSGEQFGRLKVLSREPGSGRVKYLCQCDCGNTRIVAADKLRSGHTRSCGCLRSEVSAARATRHGGTRDPLYAVLNEMHQRCENRNCYDYQWYGAKGVSVCQEWSLSNFPAFRSWAISTGYTSGVTIDRINPSGNYEPSNCRWITIQEQQRNRRPRPAKEHIPTPSREDEHETI